MANVKVEKIGGKDTLATATAFYRAGFKALDSTRRGEATVTVAANDLIDIMIAFQNAMAGDVGNLEWALAVQTAIADGAVKLLETARDKRWNKGDFDSAAAELYATDPYSVIRDAKSDDQLLASGKEAFLKICKL